MKYQLPKGRFVFLALIACVFSTVPAFGQAATGGVNGTITDSSAAVIPGVAVVLENVATNVDMTSESNQNGYFVFVNVQPGNYTLRAEQQGFKSVRVPAFAVGVNQTVTQNLGLELGAVTETIEVVAEAQ